MWFLFIVIKQILHKCIFCHCGISFFGILISIILKYFFYNFEPHISLVPIEKKTSPSDHESDVKIDSSKCSTLSIFSLQLMYYFAYVFIDFLVKRFIWAIFTLHKICGAETFNDSCIPESFNNNILHHFLIQNNLCEFTTLEHKFNRWFCTKHLVLNVYYKDFWYTKTNLNQIWYDEFKMKWKLFGLKQRNRFA